jgi:hypothetical protein
MILHTSKRISSKGKDGAYIYTFRKLLYTLQETLNIAQKNGSIIEKKRYRYEQQKY